MVHAAEPTQPLRVAVIGHTGRGDYGHGLNTMWANVPGTEVVAVADADTKGLATNLAKLKLTAGFADYRKMLTDVKPDIAVVAMRHVDQHRDAVIAACAAGVKGIYIEKSFCRTPAEADEMVDAVEKSKCKLSIAHRNRFHPVLPVVRKLIDDGAIGKVLELRGRGKEDPHGGGLDLHVLGSHVLNLTNLFGGAPRACSAVVLQEGRAIERRDVKDGTRGSARWPETNCMRLRIGIGDSGVFRFDQKRGGERGQFRTADRRQSRDHRFADRRRTVSSHHDWQSVPPDRSRTARMETDLDRGHRHRGTDRKPRSRRGVASFGRDRLGCRDPRRPRTALRRPSGSDRDGDDRRRV
ncbi:MAG: Gfo/Idh/MocA family oxidoreductase [Pirellulales bacterium]